jgi:hypothetical protein
VNPGPIRIYPEPGEPFENVSVQIDQARRDDETVRVDDAPRLLARDARRDARDLPLLDRQIVNTAQILGRVNQRSAFQKKIVHCLCSLFVKFCFRGRG